jgi:hypothetical protein
MSARAFRPKDDRWHDVFCFPRKGTRRESSGGLAANGSIRRGAVVVKCA